MRPIAYVAGPFRHNNPQQVAAHVLTAQAAALMLAAAGCAAYVPHANIGYGLGLIDESDAEGVNMTFLALSDAVFVLPGWRLSVGAKAEVKYARERGIPIFASKEGICDWLRTRTVQ